MIAPRGERRATVIGTDAHIELVEWFFRERIPQRNRLSVGHRELDIFDFSRVIPIGGKGLSVVCQISIKVAIDVQELPIEDEPDFLGFVLIKYQQIIVTIFTRVVGFNGNLPRYPSEVLWVDWLFGTLSSCGSGFQ